MKGAPPPEPQALLALRLDGGVRVGVDATGQLEITRVGHPPERRPLASGLRWPTPLVGCASASRTTGLVGLARHDLLLVIRAEAPPLRRAELGPRLAGSEEMTLHPVGRGFVVVLECGVIRLDDLGTEVWRLDRVTVGWRFLAERDEAIWLEDRDGNLVGFGVDTGFERL